MAGPGNLLPTFSGRFVPVWRRNLRVWRKLALPSMLGNFGEPLLYLLAFGYGFGRLVGQIDEMPYMYFLASGIVCSSIMFSASFEALYSAFTRMHEQKTWTIMLNAPLNVDDIVLGEIVWAATKGAMSGLAILLVASIMGLVDGWGTLWVIPLVFVIGLSFAAMAMVITALAPSYDYFLYYFTLVLTPMLLLSGVFFPLQELPEAVSGAAFFLPLAHAVALVRPLMTGTIPDAWLLHMLFILVWTAISFMIATALLRRRLAD